MNYNAFFDKSRLIKINVLLKVKTEQGFGKQKKTQKKIV
jgi:hypothetical protein